MTIVRMIHVRQCGYCASGARIFAKKHGIDWSHFLREGVDAKTLLATGDAMAVELVKAAEVDNGR